MAEITTEDQWWETLERCWDDCLAIIGHHMNLHSPAYIIPGSAEAMPTGRSILEEIIYLKASRGHHKLLRYLNAAWGLASEAYAWSVPGWGDFCDLCSEEWVFEQAPVGDGSAAAKGNPQSEAQGGE